MNDTAKAKLTAEALLAMTRDERRGLGQVMMAGPCTNCTDCKRCTNCVGITGGRSLRYVAWGVQLTRAQWVQLCRAESGI